MADRFLYGKPGSMISAGKKGSSKDCVQPKIGVSPSHETAFVRLTLLIDPFGRNLVHSVFATNTQPCRQPSRSDRFEAYQANTHDRAAVVKLRMERRR